jgi:diguanylate cyclase (GGDEF)-like protein
MTDTQPGGDEPATLLRAGGRPPPDAGAGQPGEADLAGRRQPPPTGGCARQELADLLGVDVHGLAQLSDEDVRRASDTVRLLQERLVRSNQDAAVDELTGLLRRRAGLAALELALARARRMGLPLVVAFLDVDGLKLVNDERGHAAGDEVLRGVATVLRRHLRGYDVVARVGGDEFLAALVDVGAQDARRRLAEVAVKVVEECGQGISWGLAELAEDDDAPSLIARADAQLYSGRRGARAGGSGARLRDDSRGDH